MRVGQVRRRDDGEKAIIQALKLVGACVWQLSEPSVPDLLVAYRGVWLPMEVKAEHGTLTNLQWRSYGSNRYPIVRSVDDALKAIGVKA